MALQFSVAVRNAMGDAIETTIGTSAVLKLRTGAPPATCATADSGTVVCTMSLPSDWMAAGSSGIKSLLGTWQDLLADAAGVVGHFRIYASDGTTCGMQGTVTLPGSGGDMTLINTNVAVNQPVSVSSFDITIGNA